MQRQNQDFVDTNLSKFFAFLEAENRLKSINRRVGRIYANYSALGKPPFLVQMRGIMV